MSAERFYVTTPIYYVNDAPHIGHSYTTILADVLFRYHRLFGHQVRFQTGVDEHGQKVQQAAAKRGVTPQEQADLYSQRFCEMWKLLNIHPDHLFFRTTDPEHKRRVGILLQRLFDQGDIYQETYTGWYNVSDEMFVTEKEVTEEDKESGRVIQVSESNYFFRLSKYKDWLIQYLEEHPDFILPVSRRNEILGMLRQPAVGDLCITRPKARLSWGIELPFDHDYVTYVWIDALMNYITGLGWPESAEFTTWWPSTVHLIGKDILKPHGFFWPIMLHAVGLPMPKHLLAHGWWTRGGLKESKTVSRELAAQAPVRHFLELVAEYGVDPLRYFLMREMTLGQDQDYSEEIIVQRINSDLANDLGNLVSRVTRLIQQYFDGKVPALTPDPAGTALLAKSLALRSEVWSSIEALKPNQAVEALLLVVRQTNAYVAENEPWIKAKQGDLDSAGRCLLVALQVLRRVAVLLTPILPQKMEGLLVRIGCPVKGGEMDLSDFETPLPGAGQEIPGGEPLFPRLDWEVIRKKIEVPAVKEVATEQPVPAGAKAKEKKASSLKEPVVSDETGSGLITFEDFSKVDLRLAEVIEATRVPNADKLLHLTIRLGEETRQIVAGIAEYYSPEEVLGKYIVIVANLQPRKIRGLVSHGMLLAAKDGTHLRLVTLDGEGVDTGATVG
jgi:methionyl-tRNA synthetase